MPGPDISINLSDLAAFADKLSRETVARTWAAFDAAVAASKNGTVLVHRTPRGLWKVHLVNPKTGGVVVAKCDGLADAMEKAARKVAEGLPPAQHETQWDRWLRSVGNED